MKLYSNWNYIIMEVWFNVCCDIKYVLIVKILKFFMGVGGVWILLKSEYMINLKVSKIFNFVGGWFELFDFFFFKLVYDIFFSCIFDVLWENIVLEV